MLNSTDDYVNVTLTNCTDDENNFDIVILTLLLKIPCGSSFLCLMSLMIYTLFKTLLTNK